MGESGRTHVLFADFYHAADCPRLDELPGGHETDGPRCAVWEAWVASFDLLLGGLLCPAASLVHMHFSSWTAAHVAQWSSLWE